MYQLRLLMKKSFTILFLLVALAVNGQSIFPLKISDNKRYFLTQQGKPFLYHADTGWRLFTLTESTLTLKDT